MRHPVSFARQGNTHRRRQAPHRKNAQIVKEANILLGKGLAQNRHARIVRLTRTLMPWVQQPTAHVNPATRMPSRRQAVATAMRASVMLGIPLVLPSIVAFSVLQENIRPSHPMISAHLALQIQILRLALCPKTTVCAWLVAHG